MSQTRRKSEKVGEILKQGLLNTKTAFSLGWKKKWFILTPSQLIYKDKAESESISSALDLKGSVVEEISRSRHNQDNCFEVRNKRLGKSCVVYCDKSSEYKQWLQAIRAALARFKKPKKQVEEDDSPKEEETKRHRREPSSNSNGSSSNSSSNSSTDVVDSETPPRKRPSSVASVSSTATTASQRSQQPSTYVSDQNTSPTEPFPDHVSLGPFDDDTSSIRSAASPQMSASERKLVASLNEHRDEIARLKLQLQQAQSKPDQDDVPRILERLRAGEYQAIYSCQTLSSKIDLFQTVLENIVVEEDNNEEESMSISTTAESEDPSTAVDEDSFVIDEDWKVAESEIPGGKEKKKGMGLLSSMTSMKSMKTSFSKLGAKMGLKGDSSDPFAATLPDRSQDVPSEGGSGGRFSGVMKSMAAVGGKTKALGGLAVGMTRAAAVGVAAGVGVTVLEKPKKKKPIRIGLGNTDHILAVLLFLKESLVFSTFIAIVSEYKWALNILLAYLEREASPSDFLFQVYESQGRYKEALVQRLKLAYQPKKPKERLLRLHEFVLFLDSYKDKCSCNFERKQVSDHIALLERQLKIEELDSGVEQVEDKSRPIERQEETKLLAPVVDVLKAPVVVTAKLVTGTIDLTQRATQAAISSISSVVPTTQTPKIERPSIIDTPLTETLSYCIYYHERAPDEDPRNPKQICALLRVSQIRYILSTLKVRGRKHDWSGVRALIPKTSAQDLIPGKIPFWRSRLGLEPFFQTYQMFDGPRGDLLDIANQLGDEQERFDVCMQYGVYDIAIQTVHRLKEPPNVIAGHYLELAQTIYDKTEPGERRKLRKQLDERISNYVKDARSILFDGGDRAEAAHDLEQDWRQTELYRAEDAPTPARPASRTRENRD